MRRASRPISVALLLMAVLCSPAGVCLIDGMAATVQSAAPAHAHACGSKSGDGTFLAASEDSCCTEPQTGFVNVFRFTLQKQALPPILDFARGWVPTPYVMDPVAWDRRVPLVLRI